MQKKLEEIRRSESAAREVLESLIPRRVQGAVLGIVAEAIVTANDTVPSCWGVRVDPDSVMLKVGRIEVLQVLPGFLHLVLLERHGRERVGVASRGGTPGVQSLYRSVPGSTPRDIEWQDVVSTYARVREAFLALVRAAAPTGRHSTTQRTHSPGAIRYLAGRVKQTIPQPAYLVPDHAVIALNPDEIQPDEEFSEGAVAQVLVNRAERDSAARAACIRLYGYACAGCGRTMEQRYGPLGSEVIHVHHLNPVAAARGERKVSPKRDLRPLCPNCHSVIHSASPPLSIKALSALVRQYGA